MDQARPMPLFGGRSEPSGSFIWFGRFEIWDHHVNPAAVSARILLICPDVAMAPGISVCPNRSGSGGGNEKS